MSGWLQWSQARLLTTLTIGYLLFTEITSWLFTDGTTCILNPAIYGSYYAENNECPAFHVALFKIALSHVRTLTVKSRLATIFV
jgi:hypothetical protein